MKQKKKKTTWSVMNKIKIKRKKKMWQNDACIYLWRCRTCKQIIIIKKIKIKWYFQQIWKYETFSARWKIYIFKSSFNMWKLIIILNNDFVYFWCWRKQKNEWNLQTNNNVSMKQSNKVTCTFIYFKKGPNHMARSFYRETKKTSRGYIKSNYPSCSLRVAIRCNIWGG